MGYSTPVRTPMALGITFPIIATIAVLARFHARRMKRMKWRIDDWMLVPALFLSIGNAISMLVAATHGNLGKLMPLGEDGFPVVNPEFETFQKCIYANEILTTAAIAVTRHAILLFYNRIFIGRSFNLSVWALYILNGIWGIAYIFSFAFECRPVRAFWEATRGQEKRHCSPLIQIKIYAVASIVIDLSMLLIPWPPILRLKMRRREKVAVLGIFGLGALVLGVAIGKCVEFFSVISKIEKHHQPAYDEAPTMYWTIPETCIAVVCACLPTLRPLFHGWSPESLVGSVRSALSLHSVGSGRGGSKINGSASQTQRSQSQGGDSVKGFLRGSEDAGVETVVGNGVDDIALETDMGKEEVRQTEGRVGGGKTAREYGLRDEP